MPKYFVAPLAGFIALFLAAPALPADDAQAVLAEARKLVAQDEEKPVDFAVGFGLADRLEKVPGPEAALWRYKVISRTLVGVDFEAHEKEPAKSWLAKHNGELVYSEPAGQNYVAQEMVWRLFEKWKTSPVAEEIAWEAANTSLAGECEGYLPCYMEADLMGVGRYLENYPQGKYAREAMASVYWLSEPPAPGDFPPLDESDKADALKKAERWEKILAAVPDSAQYRHGLAQVIKVYQLR